MLKTVLKKLIPISYDTLELELNNVKEAQCHSNKLLKKDIVDSQKNNTDSILKELHKVLERQEKIDREYSELFSLMHELAEQYEKSVRTFSECINKNNENSSKTRTEIDNLKSQVNLLNKESIYLYYKSLNVEDYKAALQDWYYQQTGKHIDVENPISFNEKIQWLKLYDSTPPKTQLADKYLVRQWIEETIGKEYLIPLVGVWNSADDINFNELPQQFVLKANHGSGWNIIVKNKDNLDIKKCKEKLNWWLRHNYAFNFGLELHYMNIKPRIIAEKYMSDLENGDILDYRFFCFNGIPRYIWVDSGSGTDHHKRNIYDFDWKMQDYKVNYPNIIPEPEKPATLEKMRELATKLCKDFAFVRVDFYSIKENIYFGEMTFTPQSGVGKWEREEIDVEYGKLIQLPNKKKNFEKTF